jgi:hypothetical protein
MLPAKLHKQWRLPASPAKKIVSAGADLLSDVNFGVAFGALLFPGSLLARGFLGGFFLGCLLCRHLFLPRRVSLTLSTLRMRAGSRIGPFSANGTQFFARTSRGDGNGLLVAHDFGSNCMSLARANCPVVNNRKLLP